jgi:hypothetical protein
MSTVSDDLVVDIPRSRIAVASMVGTTVEFYDYATAPVSVFPQLFLWVFGDRLYLQTCGPETDRLGK